MRLKVVCSLITALAAHGFTSTLALSSRGRARPTSRRAGASPAMFTTPPAYGEGLVSNLRRAVAMRGGAGGDDSSYVLVTGGAG